MTDLTNDRMLRFPWLAVPVRGLFLSAAYFANAQTPTVFTGPAGPIGSTNVTLTGAIVAKTAPAVSWFEWGPDKTYGSTTTPVDIGTSPKVQWNNQTIEGLSQREAYHYRLVASNAVGVIYGPDRRFTTGMRFSFWSDFHDLYPSPPAGLTNLTKIGSGHAHSVGLRNDGTVVAWRGGLDFFDDGQTNVPSGLSNVIAVAAGWYHSLAMRGDGTVVAWGQYANSTIPVTPPAGLSNVIAVAGGDSHSLALKSDGTVTAWGANSSGQISVPSNLTNAVAIAAGSTHSLALRADGNVVSWGTSVGGNQTPPSWLSNVVAISSETWHNLALRSDGTVVGWGNNSAGQTNVPVGLSNVVAVSAGFQHSLALRDDGTVFAWGSTSYVTNVPSGLSNIVAISSGDYNSLALTPQNLGPLAFSRTVTGATNSDRVITLSGWDPNGDALGFSIESMPTNGTLYQFTSAGRGSLISVPGTVVADGLNRVIFAPARNAFGVPYDSFAVVASDGETNSAAARMTVNVVPWPVISPFGFQPATNGGFVMNFAGFSNVVYLISASTNLVNWSTIGVASPTGSNNWQFIDASATNRPVRFYRVTTQ